ncbi:hypothetical protein F9L33_04710 [Amylibacter sp. SFDW26]|uniref:hypothetical protein n=1 Tax=Amylibacter sp. SFDW26 TaxID=2652722 RepID=UPI0012626F58|nr:hypothetical protein [Amylibacter sp. SFDW26]KAB7616066.1 hypothetical protein F9L33_04710 [Amylibacter sp. SFDW26]
MQNTAIITASASLFIWVATQWVRMLRNHYQRLAERRNLVHALFSEIDFNTKDLLFFVEKSVTLKQLETEFDKNPALIPHITDAHHTLIYTYNIDKLHYIDDHLITRLVVFYGLLEKIKEQIDGLNRPSYASISARGKYITLTSLLDNAAEAEKIGCSILKEFQDKYQKLNLTREFRLPIK